MLNLENVCVRGSIATWDGNTTKKAEAALRKACGPLYEFYTDATWETVAPGVHQLAEVSFRIGATDVMAVNLNIRSWSDISHCLSGGVT